MENSIPSEVLVAAKGLVVLGTAPLDNALILCRTPKHKHLEPQQIHLDRCNLESCCILEVSTIETVAAFTAGRSTAKQHTTTDRFHVG